MGQGNRKANLPLFTMGVDDQPNIYSNILIDTNPGTRPGFRFRRYYECTKCHLSFREDEVTLYQGKPYGIPCGCSRDIAQLISRGG